MRLCVCVWGGGAMRTRSYQRTQSHRPEAHFWGRVIALADKSTEPTAREFLSEAMPRGIA